MENQNILRIVLGIAIIAAFFLPLYNETVYGSAVSGWQLLTGGLNNVSDSKNVASSQLVPILCLSVVLICIVVILVLSVLRKATSVFLNLLPFLAIIILIIFSMTQAKENVGETLQAFGTGFYIMFLGSVLLPFTSIAVPNPANH